LAVDRRPSLVRLADSVARRLCFCWSVTSGTITPSVPVMIVLFVQSAAVKPGRSAPLRWAATTARP